MTQTVSTVLTKIEGMKWHCLTMKTFKLICYGFCLLPQKAACIVAMSIKR